MKKSIKISLFLALLTFALSIVWFTVGCTYQAVHGPCSISHDPTLYWMMYVMSGLLSATVVAFCNLVYWMAVD